MRDPRLDKLAGVVVGHCAAVRKGDLVTIVGEPLAMPAIEAMFEAIIKAGGHPSYHAKCESLHDLLLRFGTDEQLRHVSPFERHRLERCDVLIVLSCPVNTRCLEALDPARVVAAQSARRGLLTMSLARAARGEVRYCLTEIPGHAAAQEAGMSLAAYTDWVCRAGMLDLDDPLGAWKDLDRRHRRMIELLQTTSQLRFCVPASDGADGRRRHDGTDLTVDVSGRTWVSCAGGDNFPDGEVYSGPRSAEGFVNFDQPANYRGREIRGIRLEFRGGKVVSASAERNEAYLHELLAQDEGARVMGEIALGTNYRIDRMINNAFYDEKLGGSFHLALGAGYPQTGNDNQSALHWDIVCDLRPSAAANSGGTIEADGVVIQRDGRFLHPDWPGVGQFIR